jgi:methyl-accepting chemotaxis protein
MSAVMALTVGAAAPGAGADLLRIVRINEQIKRVVGVSCKINIMALNAIFLAKRAGSAALGFGVLSNELRVFSHELRNCMEKLTGLIHDCVNEVSVSLRNSRQERLLGAVGAGGAAAPLLGRVLQRRAAEGEEQARRLSSLRRQLRRALDDAFQMVELGGVLAKSAKIEAAYGQSFAPSLAQVSGEFDGIVEEIRSALEALRRSPFFTGY